MKLTWFHKDELFPAAIARLERVSSLLDIGCGIRPQTFVKPLIHICCEPFGQYVEHLQRTVQTTPGQEFLVLNGTWADAVKLFPPRSVDSVFLVDVIEHLEKEEALALLRATEAIARRQIAIFTPLGFMPQSHPDGKDAWGLDGGHMQEHKSGWQPDDFDDSWELLASDDFHAVDVHGRDFETPFGALWAIKTLNAEAPTAPEEAQMFAFLDCARENDWDFNAGLLALAADGHHPEARRALALAGQALGSPAEVNDLIQAAFPGLAGQPAMRLVLGRLAGGDAAANAVLARAIENPRIDRMLGDLTSLRSLFALRAAKGLTHLIHWLDRHIAPR